MNVVAGLVRPQVFKYLMGMVDNYLSQDPVLRSNPGDTYHPAALPREVAYKPIFNSETDVVLGVLYNLGEEGVCLVACLQLVLELALSEQYCVQGWALPH